MTKSIISELCDCVMQSYEESDARDMEQELIAKDISSLAINLYLNIRHSLFHY